MWLPRTRARHAGQLAMRGSWPCGLFTTRDKYAGKSKQTRANHFEPKIGHRFTYLGSHVRVDKQAAPSLHLMFGVASGERETPSKVAVSVVCVFKCSKKQGTKSSTKCKQKGRKQAVIT